MKKYILYIAIAITVVLALVFLTAEKGPLRYSSGYASDGYHFYDLPPGNSDVTDWGYDSRKKDGK